ncbi:hypothetical conserved protein [Candidatus Nitrosoglobus terrae]|uniref:Hypothetical conserved protein n=1 Tax=Candidatus Nitrosoglobus terrae TaxID=1630141 RepID=A0A1Q2SJU8_9GAMM|nr:hypothetical protein [Candidatus Nitrosoglobus terrae]BAW79391.1 hypothetical conserved protein [Candidatus Nitrosoglobus terrae]
MKCNYYHQYLWLRLSLSFILSLSLTACDGNSEVVKKGANASSNEENRVIWEEGEQYVRFNSNDRVANNQHPAAITEKDMRVVLESLLVSERQFLSKKLYPIFSPAEIQVLTPALVKGLAMARPDQDIAFVTIGVHQGAFAKVREVNTGRVFFKNGRLQIIFGMLHQEVRDLDRQTGQPVDRRLYPFVIGSRFSEASFTSTIVPEEGIAFYLDSENGRERKDWLILNVPAILARTSNSSNSSDEQMINSSLLEEIHHNRQETQNLKRDLDDLKEVIFDLKERLLEMQQESGRSSTTKGSHNR